MEVRELDGVLVAVRTLSIEKWCGAEGHLHRTMDSGRERVLERIWAHTNGASPGATLLLGLSMGDKSGMSRQARNAFAGLGLAHLTAVSGFHVGMVMLLISFVFRWLGASRRWVGLLSSPWVWGYAIVCGSSPSALRASAMATLASVMVALGRKPDGMRALAIVGLLLIVDHPGLVHGLGTQLSFLATFGILLWFQSRVERPSKLAALVAIPFWATVFTAPAAWPAFGRFPVGFLPANVLLTPCVPVLAVSAALLVVLPPEASSRLAPLVFAVSDALVQWVVWTHGILPQIELLPNPGLLAFSGAVLASFSLLGLRRNIPVYWGLALVSCLLVLRLGWMAWDRPRFHAGAHGDVVVHSAAGASFHSAGRCGSPTDLKWKTRTLLERVSMGPPLPISHSVGGRIAWSDVALVAKASGDARMWLSSPPSPCESPGPHRLPKRPFP